LIAKSAETGAANFLAAASPRKADYQGFSSKRKVCPSLARTQLFVESQDKPNDE